MLAEIRASVKKQVDAGKALDAIQQMKLTAKWDERWGKGPSSRNQIVEFAFTAVKSKR